MVNFRKINKNNNLHCTVYLQEKFHRREREYLAQLTDEIRLAKKFLF